MLCRHQFVAAAAVCILTASAENQELVSLLAKLLAQTVFSDEKLFPPFPVVMDEEYYSGSGEWEGTDGNTVRMNLLLLSMFSFAAANYLNC